MTPPHGLTAPLGTLVYRAGLAAEGDVQDALAFAERHGRRLGEVLMQRGLVNERDLTNLLANQRGLASVSLADQKIDPAAASLLSEDECRTHLAIPFRFQDSRVVVAIADPTNDEMFAELDSVADRKAVFVVASRTEIYAAIDAHFRNRPRVREERADVSAEPSHENFSDATTEPAPAPAVEPSERAGTAAPIVSPVLSDMDLSAHSAAPIQAPQDGIRAPSGETVGDALSSRLRVEDGSGVEARAHPGESERQATSDSVRDAGHEAPVVAHAGSGSEETAANGNALPAREATDQVERVAEGDRDVRFRHVELTFGTSPSADGAPPAARTEREVPSAAAALADAPRAADPGEAPASGGDREAGRFRVVLHVDGGDSLDVDTFDDEAGALAAANTLAGELADLRAWPRVGRLFIPPSRIVAIEVQEIRLHRGSAMRRRWADGDASPATGSREQFGL